MKDELYQKAVDLEIDRIARLSACDLMKLEACEKTINVDGQDLVVSYVINDWGSSRHIGVIASKKLLLGSRKFGSGMLVELEARRMTDEEAASLYD